MILFCVRGKGDVGSAGDPFSTPPPYFCVMPYDPAQVYQPEADTFLLLAAAQAEVKPGDRVLELGTGSGSIAAALVQDCDIVATDINPHAVFCARGKGLDVVQSDLCSGIRGTFDLVIFNPPYLPTQPDERIDDWLEYALDGGATGRAVIERFAISVGDVLAPGGRILLLISSLTGLSAVREIFVGHNFSADVIRRQTVEDEELFVLRITGTRT
jgi:release factor glutamine methyltransferase